MIPSSPRPEECPEGVLDAALEDSPGGAGDGEAPWDAHATDCRACSRVRVHAGAFRALERRARPAGDAAAAPAGPALLPRARRGAWPAAAAALLLAAGIATASLLHRLPPILVGSGAGDPGRVGEVALRSGLDFEAAGIGPASRVLAWTSFVAAGGAPGTAALVVREEDRSPDVIAFGPGGAFLAAASADPEVAALLREDGVHPVGLRGLVTAGRAAGTVETLVLVLTRKDRTLLLLLEPRTLRSTGRAFHRGVLTARSDSVPVLDVLPAADGGPRNLVAAGQYLVPGVRAPCLLVVSPSGAPLRHLRLPSVDFLPPEQRRVVEVRVDGSPDRPSVTVATSEHLYLEFPLRDGLPDPAAVRVHFGDDLRRGYDALFGAGAWEARVAAAGGPAALRRALAGSVEALPLDPPAGWRDR